jgi:hypothetical protein
VAIFGPGQPPKRRAHALHEQRFRDAEPKGYASQLVSARVDKPNLSRGSVLASSAPAEVFISYAHEDAALFHQLETHLKLLQRDGLISTWHDQQISAGTEWHGQIDAHLNSARVILLLISADFVASDYIYDVELRRAMERHDAGEARVIPVILRPVDNWQQALPQGGKPVTQWRPRDRAFAAAGSRRAVREPPNPGGLPTCNLVNMEGPAHAVP